MLQVMTALLTPALWCFLIVWLLWRMEIMVRYILDHNRHQAATTEFASSVMKQLALMPIMAARIEALEAATETTKSSTPDRDLAALSERLEKVEQTVTLLALGS